MPANNVAGDPNKSPEPAGPTLRFVVEPDDMNRLLQAINQAAFREHGIKMQIVPGIGLVATRPVENWPADRANFDPMFPYHFALSPDLEELIDTLAATDGVIPAPFMVEMKYSLGGNGTAGLAKN